jgi:hypothetical protein
MKTLEIKNGNKTTFKIVPDDYKEEPEKLEQKDLTTSGRKIIGFSDIAKDKWQRIFENGKK